MYILVKLVAYVLRSQYDMWYKGTDQLTDGACVFVHVPDSVYDFQIFGTLLYLATTAMYSDRMKKRSSCSSSNNTVPTTTTAEMGVSVVVAADAAIANAHYRPGRHRTRTKHKVTFSAVDLVERGNKWIVPGRSLTNVLSQISLI